MTTTTLAVYENGVLRPAKPLPFAEGETVQLTVRRADTSSPAFSSEEAQRRIEAAKTLAEAFAGAAAVVDEDEGYDLLRALDDNRKGERPLYPP